MGSLGRGPAACCLAATAALFTFEDGTMFTVAAQKEGFYITKELAAIPATDCGSS